MKHAVRDLTLTPPADEAPRPWKVVGMELAHSCTFCGGSSDATLGCPDETAPFIFQIGICQNCLADTVMKRFREVKRQRIAMLAHDCSSAVHEIREARMRAGWERHERSIRRNLNLDPEIEAEEAKKLACEEERIARKYDMSPGWSYEEDRAQAASAFRRVRSRRAKGQRSPYSGALETLRGLMSGD